MRAHSSSEENETISSVITALGLGAVGIVRLSGKRALVIAEQCFRAASGKKLATYAPRTMVYGHVVNEIGELLDEVLAVYMPAPHSYTAEDVVELQCHGGEQALKQLLRLTYVYGARPAEPGEFTKRAFLNGRLDLTQAEAVMEIIHARSETALKLATRQQQGQLAKKAHSWRQQLLDLLIHLDALIDYPEDDIENLTYAAAISQIKKLAAALDELLAHAHTGKILREGLRIAIVGRPNVGKSSLLNALLEEDRAIVAAEAGTTRDTIEEQILLKGIPLVLTDTAGIRPTENLAERQGVERSKKTLAEAELVLCVLDASLPLAEEDETVLTALVGKNFLIIANKSDLPTRLRTDGLKERFSALQFFCLSAKCGQGLDEFKDWLAQYVYGNEGLLTDAIYLQNERQENLLRQARQALIAAQEAAAQRLPYDCLEIDLRAAAETLGEITGEVVQDEIIDEIFSRFCIGK